MKKFILEEKLVIDVLNFIGTRPYNDCSGLIKRIETSIKEYVEPPKEVVKTPEKTEKPELKRVESPATK